MSEVLLDNQEVVLESETPETVSVVADGIAPLSAYDGSISSTYIEYFRGLVSKLPVDSHYLFFRDGQYSYILYYSDELSLSGSSVSGSAVSYYRLSTYNGYGLSTGSANVNENITTGMYYSDFPGLPDLRGGGYYVQISLLFVLCFIFVFVLLNLLYKLPKRIRI